MAVIVPVVAATFAISTTAATIIVAAGQIALAVGLSYGAMLLMPQTQPSTGAGKQDKPKVGTTVPRCMLFGRVATAGQIVHDNVYGADKGRLQVVYALADHEISNLISVVANSDQKNIQAVSEDGYSYSVNGFEAADRKRFLFNWLSGLPTQVAQERLVSRAEPGTRWTNDHRLRNIAYVSALFRYHSKAHPSKSPPTSMWVVDGGKWYDPRKDSTVAGGSGAHRWDNKSTWEYSDNPFVCLYNYLRGYWVEGQLWVGAGLAADEIDVAAFMAAASACDVVVTNADGTTRKRYTLSMIAEGGRNADHRAVMDAVMLATGGMWTIRGGQVWVCAGADRAPVVTITDADLLPAAPLRMSSKRSASQGLVNELYGTYTAPEREWQTKDLPPIRNTSDITEDGQRLEKSVDFSMVSDRWQARQLMRQIYRAARLQWNGQVTVGPKLIGVEPGDVIRWTSARFGWTKDFIVTNWEDQDDDLLSATWTLIETASSVWAVDTSAFAVPAVVLPAEPADSTTPQAFDADPIRLEGDNGKEIAAIEFTWTAPDDEDIDGVIFEYRKLGQAKVFRERSDDPESGIYQTSKGLSLKATYEARASWFRSDRPKERVWTSWVSVVSEGDDGGGTVTEDDLDTTAPGVPSNLTLTSNSALASDGTVVTMMAASWTAGTGASSYDVEITETAPSARPAYIVVSVGTAMEWQVRVGSTYSVRVRSANKLGAKSAWTAAVSYTAAGDTVAPGTPSGVSATGLFKSIVVQWTLGTEFDLTGYELFVSTTNSAPSAGTAATLAVGKQSSAVVENLAPGAQRFIWVRAVDASGNKSAWSAGVSATTLFVAGGELAVGFLAAHQAVVGTAFIEDAYIVALNGNKITANSITASKLEIGQRGITTAGLQFEGNAPSTNSVSWTAGSITYIADNGTPTTVSVSAGNAAWSSGTLYIYWVVGSGTLAASATTATAFQSGRIVLAAYRGGNDLVTEYGRTVIEGGLIKTGTLVANRIVAGSITTDRLEANAITLHVAAYSSGSSADPSENNGYAVVQSITITRTLGTKLLITSQWQATEQGGVNDGSRQRPFRIRRSGTTIHSRDLTIPVIKEANNDFRVHGLMGASFIETDETVSGSFSYTVEFRHVNKSVFDPSTGGTIQVSQPVNQRYVSLTEFKR